MIDHRFLFGALAALVALLIIRAVLRWNADPANPIDAKDLLMQNGRLSRGAVVMMSAFAATTWFFVYYSLTARMTEGYFALYSAAWIAPVVTRLIVGKGKPEHKEGEAQS